MPKRTGGTAKLRIPTLKNQENVVLAPMPCLTLLGFGCPLWVGATANTLNFQDHPPLGATGQVVWHANCPKTAKNRQNGSVRRKCSSGSQKLLACQNRLAWCNQVHGLVPTHASNSPKHVFAHSGKAATGGQHKGPNLAKLQKPMGPTVTA